MLEAKVSEILENILGLLSLEGSFEVAEKDEFVEVSVDTEDAGRLIGRQGETLQALQLLVNQILSRQLEKEDQKDSFKKVIIDVASWKEQKGSDLEQRAIKVADEVKASGQPVELEPMPSWQRRVIHLKIESIDGVSSESTGEGDTRHLVVKPA